MASFHTKYRDDFLQAVHSEAFADARVRGIMRFYEQADSVWTVSEASVETLREYGYKGPVTVLLNGTDIELSDPLHRRSPACESVCRDLGIRPGETVFVFIGQHIWQKNIRFLIDALLEVRKVFAERNGKGLPSTLPLFRMYFIGTGTAKREMQEKIDALGLSAEVRLLGVVRDRTFIRGILERAELFLFPSTYDTSGLVLREAGAALCPAVLVDGSMVSKGIVDGVNGYLSRETPQDYANAILRALSDPEGMERVGRGAQQHFDRTWGTVAEEVLDRYEEIIRAYARPKEGHSHG